MFIEFLWPDLPASIRSLLSQLMTASRQGHLCIRTCEILPSLPALVQDQDRLYLQRNWMVETAIVEHLIRLLQAPLRPLFHRNFLAQSRSFSPALLSAQIEAIRHAFFHPITILSGGPGTGKTFTAAQLIHNFTDALVPTIPSLRVKVAAPTGKAADRLAQSIEPRKRLDLETMTLHRLLELRPGKNQLFKQHFLTADLILVDEASMMDASLLAHLFAAIPAGARLVLLGDADQLPPINGGSLFPDLADLFPLRLDQCHRIQDQDLHRLYQAARTGDLEPLLAILEPFPQDFFAWLESVEGKVICPLRKGPFGVNEINAALLKRQERRLAIGDHWSAPLLITSNDAELQLYNGSTGLIVGKYQGGILPHGSEEVHFADGRRFPIYQLTGYEIAYAFSIHKSQGSEFDEIICLLPSGSEEFGREALYTALTRAKKKIRLIGEREVLKKMLSARTRTESGFRERIKSRLEKG